MRWTINTKSVIAGEYTAPKEFTMRRREGRVQRKERKGPPAHGPMMRESWGITPEDITLRWNTSA